MGEQVFRGKSTDAAAPFIASDFWKDGVSIAGVIERIFKIEGRNSYSISLLKPVEIEGVECETVSLGESAGLRMALQAAKCFALQTGDQIVLTCVGETVSKKKGKDGKPLSPRKDFEIEVTRPEVEGEIPEYAL